MFNHKVYVSIGILFLFGFFNASAQNLKKVTRNPYRNTQEQFQVLKENPKIKEGSYLLKIDGIVYQEGSFKNNQRSGVWKIYKAKNVIDFTYDYDNQQIVFFNKDYFPNPQDSLSRGPVYLGGLMYFNSCVFNSLEITIEMIEEMKGNHDYKAFVGFEVDSIGNPSNFEIILTSNNAKIDLSAISAIKIVSKSFPFLPGLEKGKPVNSRYISPVTVTISL